MALKKEKIENKSLNTETVIKDRRPKKLLTNKKFDTEIVGTGKSKNLPKNESKICTESAAKILVEKGFATILK